MVLLAMHEVYFNQPKYGVQPSDPFLSPSTTPEPSEKGEKGVFNLINRSEIDPGNIICLSDYQNFVNCDWKCQHGEYEATKRFHNGMVEEYKEFVLEYVKNTGVEKSQLLDMSPLELTYFVSQRGNIGYFDAKLTDEDVEKIVSEAGDLIFYTIATMSNNSADLDASMKQLMFHYVSSVADFSRTKLPYRDLQAEISTSPKPIAAAAIDQLIEQGFEPIPFNMVNAMNIDFDDRPEWGISQHFEQLLHKVLNLRRLSNHHYQYYEDDEPLTTEELAKHYQGYDHQVMPIGELAANILLETAYLVRHTTNKTLSDIIEKNVFKITGRVSAGLIDKSDGYRPDSLL